MRKAVHEMTTELEVGEIHTKGEEWGGQLVRHLDLPPGTDFTPLFQGLPGGHTGWTDEGVVFIELSPAEDLRPILEHVGAQLARST